MAISVFPPAPEIHEQWIRRLSPAAATAFNSSIKADVQQMRAIEARCWHRLIVPDSDQQDDNALLEPLHEKEAQQLTEQIEQGGLAHLAGDVGIDVLILLRIEAILTGSPTLHLEDDVIRCPIGVLSLNAPEGTLSTFGHPWPSKAEALRANMPGCLGNSILSRGQRPLHADRSFHSIRDQFLRPDQGGDFALTQQLSDTDSWTPEIIMDRQRQLAHAFLAALGLSPSL